MGCDGGLLQASAVRHETGPSRFERLAVVDCSIMRLYVRVATMSGKSDGAAEKGWKRELVGACLVLDREAESGNGRKLYILVTQF